MNFFVDDARKTHCSSLQTKCRSSARHRRNADDFLVRVPRLSSRAAAMPSAAERAVPGLWPAPKQSCSLFSAQGDIRSSLSVWRDGAGNGSFCARSRFCGHKTWWLTSQTNLSLGVVKTLCSAMVSSTTPRSGRDGRHPWRALRSIRSGYPQQAPAIAEWSVS